MLELFIFAIMFCVFAAVGLMIVQMVIGFIILALSLVFHGIVWVFNKVRGK